jgi:hypothetical protein
VRTYDVKFRVLFGMLESGPSPKAGIEGATVSISLILQDISALFVISGFFHCRIQDPPSDGNQPDHASRRAARVIICALPGTPQILHHADLVGARGKGNIEGKYTFVDLARPAVFLHYLADGPKHLGVARGSGGFKPVIVHVIISNNGRVLDAEPLQDSDSILTPAAVKLVESSQYPGWSGGERRIYREAFITVTFRPRSTGGSANENPPTF